MSHLQKWIGFFAIVGIVASQRYSNSNRNNNYNNSRNNYNRCNELQKEFQSQLQEFQRQMQEYARQVQEQARSGNGYISVQPPQPPSFAGCGFGNFVPNIPFGNYGSNNGRNGNRQDNNIGDCSFNVFRSCQQPSPRGFLRFCQGNFGQRPETIIISGTTATDSRYCYDEALGYPH